MYNLQLVKKKVYLCHMITPPIPATKILLHTCCAPCSSAIVEALLQNNIQPTLYFYNPNIFPESEYIRRKNEVIRFAESLQLEYIDEDYVHQEWLHIAKDKENEPERGSRCLECFRLRLKKTAEYAYNHNHTLIATTLSTSRWKSLTQINIAGEEAASQYPNMYFWGANWRKGGLQNRRSELIKTYGFYNQTYCGCEFSMPQNKDIS